MSAPTRDLPSPRKKTSLIFLCLALLIGGALRFTHLDNKPEGIHPDEVLYGYEGWSIMTTGCDYRRTGCPPVYLKGYSTDWDNRTSVLYPYIFSLLWRVVPMNDWFLRFPSAVFGLATVWLVFLIGRQLFPSRSMVAGWAAVLTALSPVAVIWSRIGHDPIAMPFFASVIVYATIRAQRQAPWYLLAAGSLALGLYGYQPFKVVGPAVMLLSLWYAWPAWTKRQLRWFSAAGGLALLIVLPFLINQFSNWSIVQQQFSQVSISTTYHPWSRMVYQLLVMLLVVPFFPALSMIIILPAAAVAWAHWRQQARTTIFLSAWAVAAMIPGLLTVWTPMSSAMQSRTLGLTGPLELLAAMGIVVVAERLGQWFHSPAWRQWGVVATLGGVLFFFAAVSGMVNAKSNASTDVEVAGLDQAIRFIQQPAYRQRSVIIDLLYYPQALQTLWYAKIPPSQVQASSTVWSIAGVSQHRLAQYPSQVGRFSFCHIDDCYRPGDGRLYIVPMNKLPSQTILMTFPVTFQDKVLAWKIVDTPLPR